MSTKETDNKPKSVQVGRTFLVNYGPISIRKRRTTAPTLATGRRSKDALIQGEEKIKLDLRRQRNREASRRLKEVRTNIEDSLREQVSQLESEEEQLLNEINFLYSYKQYLEYRYQRTSTIYDTIVRTAAAILDQYKYKQQQLASFQDDDDDDGEEEEEKPSSMPIPYHSYFQI